MKTAGYEIKQGKHLAVKGWGQQRFVRLSSLGKGYREEDIRTLLSGEKQRESKASVRPKRGKPVSLLIDVQRKMQEKGAGYARWATVYNLKQMAKTLVYLRNHQVDSADQLRELAAQTAAKRDKLLSSIQTSERRLAEIATLKKHIINYSKTRSTYETYRKAGYSRKFFEAHREELNAEYAELLLGKKTAYAEYRKLRDEAQELTIAERNIASLYESERQEQQKEKEEKTH